MAARTRLRVRHRAAPRTGLFPTGGIDADVNRGGRAFAAQVGVKGFSFHYVCGFRIDDDGVRRFHQRRPHQSIDDFEAEPFDNGVEIDVVPGGQMFTRTQLLNKQDRDLEEFTPGELAAEDLNRVELPTRPEPRRASQKARRRCDHLHLHLNHSCTCTYTCTCHGGRCSIATNEGRQDHTGVIEPG